MDEEEEHENKKKEQKKAQVNADRVDCFLYTCSSPGIGFSSSFRINVYHARRKLIIGEKKECLQFYTKKKREKREEMTCYRGNVFGGPLHHPLLHHIIRGKNLKRKGVATFVYF